MTVYPQTPVGVNSSAPISSLKPRLRPFYRLLLRLSRQRGYAYPRTKWLCAEFGKDDATIRRWLAELKKAGLIRTEETPGVERRIYPLAASAEPVNATPPARKMRGVPLSSPLSTDGKEDNSKQERLPRPPADTVADAFTDAFGPVVDLLRRLGVTESMARRLAAQHDGAQIAAQAEALPHRRATLNPAGLLVAAIREGWPLPPAFIEARERVRREADRRREGAARRVLEEKRREQADALHRALEALPQDRRVSLEREAEARLEREKPAAWRMARGRACAASLVRAACLEILSTRGSSCPA